MNISGRMKRINRTDKTLSVEMNPDDRKDLGSFLAKKSKEKERCFEW